MIKPTFTQGLKHGIPTALGYFVVSFTFGMMASLGGLSSYHATLISMTSLTSAGQFAGLGIMLSQGGYIELIVSMLVINSRYMLMSTALSQKIERGMALWKKMVIAAAVTDENFSIAMVEVETVTFRYYLGLMTLPYLGWTFGTLSGSLMDNLMTPSLQNAASIALYCMFIALFVPPAKENGAIRQVIFISVALSVSMYYMDVFDAVSIGYKILIAAVSAALYGAIKFPQEVV